MILSFSSSSVKITWCNLILSFLLYAHHYPLDIYSKTESNEDLLKDKINLSTFLCVFLLVF